MLSIVCFTKRGGSKGGGGTSSPQLRNREFTTQYTYTIHMYILCYTVVITILCIHIYTVYYNILYSTVQERSSGNIGSSQRGV